MKLLLPVLLLALLIDPGKISRINALKSEAKEAYTRGDYKTAIEKYRYLKDSLQVTEDEVLLNLAHAYFLANDSVNTFQQYQRLTQSANPKIKSVAHQQLGVLANRQGKFEEALASFKQALRADPANEDARYNYEMVKKKLDEQKKEEEQKKQDPNKQDQNQEQKKEQNKDQKQDQKQNQKQDNKDQKDQQNKDQQQKEQQDQQSKEKKEQKQQKDQEQKEKEQEKESQSVSDKLKQMEMSEEKARMILEAMKNQEIQYLQQNKRKATKPRDKGKPDW
jgi:Ca-activated chloride channel family protein